MIDLLEQLLNCNALNVYDLDRLLTSYNIKLDIEKIRMNHWVINGNILIHEAYIQIKDMFLSENYDDITNLWIQCDDLEEWKEFKIYQFDLLCYLWFKNEKLEELYQDWKRKG